MNLRSASPPPRLACAARFAARADAERALRELGNAGYARATLDPSAEVLGTQGFDATEARQLLSDGGPGTTLVTVAAARAGAARAVEILERNTGVVWQPGQEAEAPTASAARAHGTLADPDSPASPSDVIIVTPRGVVAADSDHAVAPAAFEDATPAASEDAPPAAFEDASPAASEDAPLVPPPDRASTLLGDAASTPLGSAAPPLPDDAARRPLQDASADGALALSEVAAAPSEITAPSVELREERLVVSKQRRRKGARLRKRVVQEPHTVEVTVAHDELVIERREPESPTPAGPLVPEPGDTVRVPLMREELVVEKRMVPVEDITIGVRRVERVERIETTLRREDLAVDDDSLPPQAD